MKTNTLRKWVRSLLFMCGIGLAAVIFLPIWRIELDAPQYPEGLVLQIYANKLAGDVATVNGLNHYIGMRTLHEEDFIEFKVLPYVIGFIALLCFIAGIVNRKKWLYAVTILFIIFAVVAMIDFWKWEYEYGHNLDPTAPIQVPGMSYQPPLIGFKQLLNFGAFSIPDTGGWIFVAVGVGLVLSSLVEWKKKEKKGQKKASSIAVVMLMLVLTSCSTEPQPIKVGVDNCHFCKMTIADNRFGAEIVTKKGKAYKFDDIICLLEFQRSDEKKEEGEQIYVVDFSGDHKLIKAGNAFLLKSEQLKSPMGSNTAAFSSQQQLNEFTKTNKGQVLTWQEIEAQ